MKSKMIKNPNLVYIGFNVPHWLKNSLMEKAKMSGKSLTKLMLEIILEWEKAESDSEAS